MDERLHLGLDIGTSGLRGLVIDSLGTPRAGARQPMSTPQRVGPRVTQDPEQWWQSLKCVLASVLAQIDRKRLASIAVDGTSGTLLLTDARGAPLTQGWMYNDASCGEEAARIDAAAPPGSVARGIASPLARLLHLQAQAPQAAHVLHQADWLAGRLAARFGVSDDNNVLKLGYDVVQRRWPDWFDALGVCRRLLPQVQAPGRPLGPIAGEIAREFDLPPQVQIVTGTTDGVASFLATGARNVGEAVTSLGSTLVVKVLGRQPIFAPQCGIYSHRLDGLWLIGGASNSGGAVLQQHFSAERMARLTPQLRPEEPTGLDYYPLPAPGERFPINDAGLMPRLAPRPDDEVRFFQALLEGIAGVERLAFERIAELGAPYPSRVHTVGGGARNAAWTRLREQRLGVPVVAARHEEAAYGSALLARRGVSASPVGNA